MHSVPLVRVVWAYGGWKAGGSNLVLLFGACWEKASIKKTPTFYGHGEKSRVFLGGKGEEGLHVSGD